MSLAHPQMRQPTYIGVWGRVVDVIKKPHFSSISTGVTEPQNAENPVIGVAENYNCDFAEIKTKQLRMSTTFIMVITHKRAKFSLEKYHTAVYH